MMISLCVVVLYQRPIQYLSDIRTLVFFTKRETHNLAIVNHSHYHCDDCSCSWVHVRLGCADLVKASWNEPGSFDFATDALSMKRIKKKMLG